MDTKLFLRSLLPPKGIYVLLRINSQTGNLEQTSYTDIDDLERAAIEADRAGLDVYFALSSFCKENSRKAVDAKYIQSFFLDLDCGADKPHATQVDVIQELQSFCAATKLPKPLIVSSGRGVHVYWMLREAVSVTDWKPVAQRLKNLCAEHKFEIDTSVPADAARVLRVLGTHNYKPDSPAPVQLLSGVPKAVDFDWFSEAIGGPVITVPTKHEEGSAGAFAEFLLKSSEFSFKDILIKTNNGNGCAQLGLIVANQEVTTEPMWRAGLSITKFCRDGDKAAHMLSAKHPEYVPHLTETKKDLVKGPYRCATFDENNPNVCTDCPHWGKIKSPIVLGRRFKASEDCADSEDSATNNRSPELTDSSELALVDDTSEHVIPTYPRPYFRGASGGVFVRSTNPDGETDERVIYQNDIYVTRRLHDVETGEMVVVRLHLPKDGVREFTLPLTALTSREEFRKNMAAMGVAVLKQDDLQQYMTTWVNELQAKSVADTAHRQYGWSTDECRSFVVGDKEIHPNKISYNPPTVPTMQSYPFFKTKGTLEGWQEMANFYLSREGMEMHQYIVCTAFGSPLMQFLPQNCATMHVHDKAGGAGKTAAMKVAAAAWGHFKGIVVDDNDTTSFKMNRGEVLHNLPFYIDEVTNTPEKEMSGLAYQLTSGQQRGRMSNGSNIERTRGEPWKLLCCTTGNMSAIEKISLFKAGPKAEAQRILEHRARQIFSKSKDKELTDNFERSIEEHYGHAGPIFIQHVMNHIEHYKGQLRIVQQTIDRRAGLAPENRFWSAGAACAITGGMIAQKLGLVDYDMEAITKWIVGLLKENKKNVSEMGASVEQVLNDYIMEHYGNVLWIKSTDDLRKQNETNILANGLDSLVVPDAIPKVKFVARYETDIKRMYLLPKPLKEWCGKQQINYAGFVEDLIGKLKGKRTKMRLSKGTQMRLPPTSVIVVNFSIDDE